MAATAAQFADFLEPKLSNIWHDAYPAFESMIAQVMNIRDMNKNTITDAKLAGFGSLQNQNDGADVQFDDPLAPAKKSYTYAVRALAYRVHERLWRYDLYSEVERFEMDLKDAARDDVEAAAASIFNNGFGTTNTGFDGLALFSTSHTRLDSGPVQANSPATDEALSVSGLHNGIITIGGWLNERGRPRVHKVRRLIVPNALQITAAEILGSDKMPYTANNEPNVVNTKFGLSQTTWNYLTSSTAWFLQCENHDLNWFWAFRPESGMRTKWENESVERKIRQGYAYGFGDWFGNYGTDGVA